MLAHAYNLSFWETEAGGCEFGASLVYIASPSSAFLRPYLKTTTKQTNGKLCIATHALGSWEAKIEGFQIQSQPGLYRRLCHKKKLYIYTHIFFHTYIC
jgi:hypothetical protein